MSPLLLIVPVIAILLAPWSESDVPPPSLVRPAEVASEMAPTAADLAHVAFGVAKEHLAAGRLPMAAYYFEQAAQHGHDRPEVFDALAYVHYRENNLERGDAVRAQAGASAAEGEWRGLADGERILAARRIEAAGQLSARLDLPRPAPRPAVVPARVTPMPLPDAAGDEVSPGQLVGARACGALVAGQRGKGMSAVRFLGDRGVNADCLVTEDGPAPAETTIWYQEDHAATAKAIAAMLPGGAVLKPAADLSNAVEIRLGRTFIDADQAAFLGELTVRISQQ
jgi:hypothetical protein